jgi:hypothetical protein
MLSISLYQTTRRPAPRTVSARLATATAIAALMLLIGWAGSELVRGLRAPARPLAGLLIFALIPLLIWFFRVEVGRLRRPIEAAAKQRAEAENSSTATERVDLLEATRVGMERALGPLRAAGRVVVAALFLKGVSLALGWVALGTLSLTGAPLAYLVWERAYRHSP